MNPDERQIERPLTQEEKQARYIHVGQQIAEFCRREFAAIETEVIVSADEPEVNQ